MLSAEPSGIARTIITRYFYRRARRHLAGVHIAHGDQLAPWERGNNAPEPLILIANHSSWWDAVLPILISLHHLDHDAYGMMEERQLARFRFFRNVGMFSIDRQNPRSALRSLDYAAELLRGSGRVLWLFPQGEIVPNDHRPISFFSGTSRLIRMIGSCVVVPVAFRYELVRNERPDAYGLVGTAQQFTGAETSSIREVTDLLQTSLTTTVDTLRSDTLEENVDRYRTIIQGRRSIDREWDRARGIEG